MYTECISNSRRLGRIRIHYLQEDIFDLCIWEKMYKGRFEMYSIEVDCGENFAVAAGDSIRFKADKPHVYRNNGSGCCNLSMVIYYSA